VAAPQKVELVRVRSAAEMHAAVMQQALKADVAIMAAAVADYTPRLRVGGKLEKSDEPMSLDLVRTPDILAGLGQARAAGDTQVLIGFAAESGDPVARAREKLVRKRADMIVANDITRSDAGFDSETNAVTIVTAAGDEEIPLASKAQVAAKILDRAEKLLARVPARST
jgi:phosphopantothenoylcysteine decarboxylase/phosphopantothenate--cysteine ligase